MSHLLVVQRLNSKAMRQKGTVPLMLEFNVSPETAPYLVSSSSSVMWINEPHPGDLVKAAIREMAVSEFFREVIDAVVAMGQEMQWGNVHPLTLEGLLEAVEHVSFYEMGPLELLTPRANQPDQDVEDDEDEGEPEEGEKRVRPADLMPAELRPLIEEVALPFRPSSWVPPGTIVVVPKDRAFVGVVSKVTPRKIAGLVHNAARGIAVVRGTVPHELAVRPPAPPVAD